MENSIDAGAGLLERSLILTISAIHLIAVVPACLLGLALAKVTLNSLIHPSIHARAGNECRLYRNTSQTIYTYHKTFQ